MPSDYGSKVDLIASKFLVEIDLLSVEFFGQNDWSINFIDIEVKIFLTFFSNRNFLRTALCISSKFIGNFVCDIDNMGANFHQDRTIEHF